MNNRNFRLVSFFVIIAFFSIYSKYDYASDNIKDEHFTFKESQLCNGLMTGWLSIIVSNSEPEERRRNSALNFYAFMFQYWMTTEHQGIKNPLLSKHFVDYSMRQINKYVDLNDPMHINYLYEGNTLSAGGLNLVDMEPIVNGDDIFLKKENYQSLVRDFSKWREQQMSPTK